MERSIGPGVVAAALLLAACTGGGSVDAPGASGGGGADGSAGAATSSAGVVASATDRANDRTAAPSASSSTAPSSSPSPPSPSAPTWTDAGVVLREDEGFDEATVAEVASLVGVTALGASRDDEVPLWSSRTSDGQVVDAFADGFRVVVTALVDSGDLPGRRVRPGEVLLTPRGAALRGGLDVGGRVVLGPDRTPLRVAATAVEQDPYGSAEMVLHAGDGDAVGVEPLDRLLLRLDEGVDLEALTGQLRTLVGSDDPRAVEVRDPTARRGRRTLSASEAKQRFGEFAFRDRPGTRDVDQEQAWVDANITSEQVPLLGTVRCHAAILDDLRSALDEVVEAGLSGWVDPSRFGGCWYPRRIGEDDGLSKHAWGIALDVNVDVSVPGGGEVPPSAVVRAFRRNGFSWGGDFPTPDNHHFEWVGDEA